jgi:hypothetical protein
MYTTPACDRREEKTDRMIPSATMSKALKRRVFRLTSRRGESIKARSSDFPVDEKLIVTCAHYPSIHQQSKPPARLHSRAGGS